MVFIFGVKNFLRNNFFDTYSMIHEFLPKLISMLLSWIDSSNLRTRVYQQEEQLELYRVGIMDIERINANSANPNALIAGIIHNLK